MKEKVRTFIYNNLGLASWIGVWILMITIIKDIGKEMTGIFTAGDWWHGVGIFTLVWGVGYLSGKMDIKKYKGDKK